MTALPSRREFLRTAALGAGGLALGFSLPGCGGGAEARIVARAEKTGEFCPNAWLTIAPNDRIVFWLDRVEMGQGTMTSHTMLIAEELEVDPRKIQVEFAPAHRAYDNPDPELGFQITGGSSSTNASWGPLRAAGATARDMLRAAAAAEWGVAVDECVADDGAVAHAASGRRAKYGALALAAARQPVPPAVLKSPDRFKWVGKPLVRFDAARKVDGSGVFGIDVQLPGLLTAVVLRPPGLDGRMWSLDAEAARAQPGTVGVFDVPSGVAVVSTSYWRARAAAELVRVRQEEGKLVSIDSDRLAEQYRARLRKPAKAARKQGDAEGALSSGALVVEAIYEAPFLAHATMEPQNCTVLLTEERCEIWAPTQSAALAQEEARRITGLPRSSIVVHTTLLGGGFGRRLAQDYVTEAVHVARHVPGRPVKVVWSREDDMRHDCYRPMTAHLVRGAVGRDGTVVAWLHRIVGQAIVSQIVGDWLPAIAPNAMPHSLKVALGRTASSLLGKNVQADPSSIHGIDFAYAIENLRVEYAAVEPGVPVGFWRSVGHSQNAFVVESFLDELAHAAKVDPFALRKQLLRGQPRQVATLQRAAHESGWGTPLSKGRGRGIAHWHSFGTSCSQVAEVSVSGNDVRVERVVAAVDCGTAINPDLVKAQIESGIVFGLSAALKQSITIRAGRVQQGNFNDYPVLRMHEMPAVEVHLLPSREPPSGVGEPGLPPIAPAVANAIFAAAGRRVRKLPIEAALKETT